MKEPKHISEILRENPCKRGQSSNLFETMPSTAGLALREIAQNPQSDFEKAIVQLPCMQTLLQSDEKSCQREQKSNLFEVLPSAANFAQSETPLENWLDN
jgi:hypothetical protein